MNQLKSSSHCWRRNGQETKVNSSSYCVYVVMIALYTEEGRAKQNKWNVYVHQFGLGAQNR